MSFSKVCISQGNVATYLKRGGNFIQVLLDTGIHHIDPSNFHPLDSSSEIG